MPLECDNRDWLEVEQANKELIINDIAAQLGREHPNLFTGSNLLSMDHSGIETIVRQAVIGRSDVMAHEIDDIVSSIFGQATGYGVLQEFFTQEAIDITEVFLNPSKEGPKVFYGQHGRPWPAKKKFFNNNEEVLRYCQKICNDSGKDFSESTPIVDAWLADGSRIAVVGFKASPLGVSATIRKSPTTRPPMELDKLVQLQMLPRFVADMLVDLLVKGHANLGIFGRTDSGKTTFLRALGLHIEPDERTFIAETSFEMFMPNLRNCINLVEVAVGSEVSVDMSMLCRTMNRNNPDRAILGEIRSKEVIAASQIASSTSGGFWTTGHAGDVNQVRTRIWGMFLDGGVQLPKDFLDEIVSSMFHFLIFVDKETISPEKKRTLMSLVEIVPGAGYRTIIRFDVDEFAATHGKVRRWIYENPISSERLNTLSFRGAKILSQYEAVGNDNRYIYDGGGRRMTVGLWISLFFLFLLIIVKDIPYFDVKKIFINYMLPGGHRGWILFCCYCYFWDAFRWPFLGFVRVVDSRVVG